MTGWQEERGEGGLRREVGGVRRKGGRDNGGERGAERERKGNDDAADAGRVITGSGDAVRRDSQDTDARAVINTACDDAKAEEG